ncbi:hypothetical protein KJR58_19975, partial [Escherichia coli]|uniref:hypothetical protein n=1 Tax=Escherichia coli TaxID=562 RepID=UPI002004CE6D
YSYFFLFFFLFLVMYYLLVFVFFFQREDGMKSLPVSRGLRSVYKRQVSIGITMSKYSSEHLPDTKNRQRFRWRFSMYSKLSNQ